MSEFLCTQCGKVGVAAAGKCDACGSADLLPADAPSARKFIEARAPKDASTSGASVRAEATGKVLGRAFGKLFKK